MKKIIFIEPNPPDFHIFTRVPLPRLGTVLLGTILKEHGYEVKSYVESLDELDLLDVLSADAVGISTITSTSKRIAAAPGRPMTPIVQFRALAPVSAPSFGSLSNTITGSSKEPWIFRKRRVPVVP